MAERTTADGSGADAPAGEEPAAAALDNADGGTSAATPIAAARSTKPANESADPGTDGAGEDGTMGAGQEARPVRTAADIVAENAAKKRAEQDAAKAQPEPPAAATTTRTAVKRPVSKPAAQSVDTSGGKGRAALTAAGQGLARARNLIASLVWLVAVLCAAVLALGALFTALSQTNESNEIVTWVLARGEDLVGPFGDLFKLKTAKNTLLVNWGIAALAYLVVGKIAERIIRP